MTGFTRCATVILFMGAALVNAEYKPAIQGTGGLKVKFSEDLTIHGRGGVNFFNQLDQYIDGKENVRHENQGLTAKEGGAGIEVAIGKLGNLEISGGGEFFILFRDLVDSVYKQDFFEVRPTGLLNLTLPLGGVFKAQYLSRFERRIFRQPFKDSKFRYNAQTRLSANGILPLGTGLFLFYDGFVQKTDRKGSMSRWGGGVTMEPLKNLFIEGSYSMLWNWDSQDPNSNIYPVFVGIYYTLDFSK